MFIKGKMAVLKGESLWAELVAKITENDRQKEKRL